MTAAMRERLGEEMEAYVVLGACNPPLAYRALGVDRSIGLLLPCNVVVRRADDRTVSEALDPQVMVTLTAEPAITPIAEEAARRLRQALTGWYPHWAGMADGRPAEQWRWVTPYLSVGQAPDRD
jgi:hypothetical protein